MSEGLEALLRGTSRSFYLSLRLLPAATRSPIGLTYLLARAADTVADTPVLTVARRRAQLERLEAALGGSPAELRRVAAEIASAVTGRAETPAEDALVARFPAVVEAHLSSPRDLLDAASRCLREIVRGMVYDLSWFPDGERGADAPPPLPTWGRLERYCYQVAGVVGEYWTEVHALRGIVPTARDAPLRRLGVGYGLGLQLVNVARDIPRDLARGRCYLPAEALAPLRLTPADLRVPARFDAARPAVQALLRRAVEGCGYGVSYCRGLPASAWRLRLASVLPVAIGCATLRLLAAAPTLLDPGRVIKVTRRRVYRIVAAAFLRLPSSRAQSAWLGREWRAASFALRPARGFAARSLMMGRGPFDPLAASPRARSGFHGGGLAGGGAGADAEADAGV